jgi:hypothetical protein
MRVMRYAAPAVLSLTLLAACSSDKATSSGTTLSLAEKTKLATQFSAMGTKLATAGNADAAVAMNLGAAAIILGGTVTDVTLNTAAAAASLQRQGFKVVTGQGTELAVTAQAYRAVALQLRYEAPGDTSLISALLLFKDSTDFVLGFGVGEGTGTIGSTASAFFWTPPSAYWEGTAGTATLTKSSTGGNCQNFTFPPQQGYTITCKTANFSGAMNVTNATVSGSFTGNTATGTRTASLSSQGVGGVYIVESFSGK